MLFHRKKNVHLNFNGHAHLTCSTQIHKITRFYELAFNGRLRLFAFLEIFKEINSSKCNQPYLCISIMRAITVALKDE